MSLLRRMRGDRESQLTTNQALPRRFLAPALFATETFHLPLQHHLPVIPETVSVTVTDLSREELIPISPQALLDQLARHALDSASSPTALRLSCVALAHHSHLQFTEIGLLDQIKVAAGRSGDASSRSEAQIALTERLRSNPAGSRNIFAHAAMLRCLLNRFTFE